MKRLIIQNLKVGLLFFAIQLFVGLIFLYKSFNQETVIMTALFSCVTTLVFLFIIVVIQMFYMKNNKISLNDFDIKPTQTTIFSVDKTYEETLAIIQNIIPENKIFKSNMFGKCHEDTKHIFFEKDLTENKIKQITKNVTSTND